MKQIIRIPLLLMISIISLVACREENNRELMPDIKVGKEESSLNEVVISKETTRNIILSGGNGKYSVNIENSKFADAKISNDTLKIQGILEGETFATITSHNKKVKLGIRVVSPEVTISHDSITLYPTAESKAVSLSGGGDIVDLKIDDPDNIMKVKWNGATGILEIIALYEGEATITAKSETSPNEKVLKVKIRAEGEINEAGVYSTRHRHISPAFETKMLVQRKNVGVWMTGSTNPYGIIKTFYKKVVLKTPPIRNPKAGEYLTMNVSMYPFTDGFEGIHNGENKFYVDEVRQEDGLVVLRGKGFRFVLPYEK